MNDVGIDIAVGILKNNVDESCLDVLKQVTGDEAEFDKEFATAKDFLQNLMRRSQDHYDQCLALIKTKREELPKLAATPALHIKNLMEIQVLRTFYLPLYEKLRSLNIDFEKRFYSEAEKIKKERYWPEEL